MSFSEGEGDNMGFGRGRQVKKGLSAADNTRLKQLDDENLSVRTDLEKFIFILPFQWGGKISSNILKNCFIILAFIWNIFLSALSSTQIGLWSTASLSKLFR
jgi:hypothetical protein